MNTAVLYILQYLLVGGYTFSLNKYRRQLRIESDTGNSESVNTNGNYKILAQISNSSTDFVAPTELHKQLSLSTLNTNQIQGNSTIVKDILQRILRFNVPENKISFKERKENLDDNPKLIYPQTNIKQFAIHEGDINGMDSNYKNEKATEENQYNPVEKVIVDTHDSKDDFEYQLSRFLDYPKTQDNLTDKDYIEEVTVINEEQFIVITEVTFEVIPAEEDRMKRELEPDSRYLFNIKPAEDVNEGEPTSTETNNSTSRTFNETDKVVESELIDNTSNLVNVNNTNTSTNGTNTSFLENLMAFLLAFYATIRDLAANLYTMISNKFEG